MECKEEFEAHGRAISELRKKLCDYIAENSDKIVVRVNYKGEWRNMFLTELPSNLAIEEALRFVKEFRFPLVIKSEESKIKGGG